MLFRIFDLYQQGRDLKENPAGFSAGLARDSIAPIFVLPIILLAVAAIGMMITWWLSGWGIFIFLAIVTWIILCGVHTMYAGMSRLFGDASNSVQTSVTKMRQHHVVKKTESVIIDVEARE